MSRTYTLACMFIVGLFVVGSVGLAEASSSTVTRNSPVIVDHRHTDISQIPDHWIDQAKGYVVHYAHTSHGGQILSGLRWLENWDEKYNVDIEISGSVVLPDDTSALRIYDGNNYPGDTYITPDQYWETSGGIDHTRSTMDSGYFDFSLWTWCGQMSYYSTTQVGNYNGVLTQLEENEYPNASFIYYTGHTDGTTPDSGSHLWENNTLVRDHVADHNKVLFDFADIESYDPGGNFHETATDACPWCNTWCSNNPTRLECQAPLPSCAHSHGTQCILKASAFWWLMARLAGWDGEIGQAHDLPADFDGDGSSDISVYRPSTNKWFIKDQYTTPWGTSGDLPVPGDYDGDGSVDVAVYRPSTGKWFIKGQYTATYGTSTDVPVPGDYNGDGITDIAIFRPSTGNWFIRGQYAAKWGTSTDIPIPGDYNGDGITDIAIYRPATGKWFIKDQYTVSYGSSDDIPVPGDYNSDGSWDVAVYRPASGKWFIRGQYTAKYGAGGDIPVPGDYDGNGSWEVAIFRPSNGKWFVRGQPGVPYGNSGDYPLPARDTNADGDPYE